MALTADIDTVIGKIRFLLGDQTEGGGVLPGGANLTDEEIGAMLVDETDESGGTSVGRTAAALAAVVARRWAQAVATSVGPLSQEHQQIYDHWRAEAKALKAQYGGVSARMIRSVTMTPTHEADPLGEWLV